MTTVSLIYHLNVSDNPKQFYISNEISGILGISQEKRKIFRKFLAPNTTEDFDHLMKILVIGDRGVGKSSAILRFADGGFPDQCSNYGVDFVCIF